MSERTSKTSPLDKIIDDIPANDIPGSNLISTSKDDDNDVFQAIADLANEGQQAIIDGSVLSDEEAEDLKDIEVDDVFADEITGMDMNLSRKSDYVIFGMKSSLDLPRVIDKSDVTYVVKMNSKAMKAAEAMVKKAIEAIIPFDIKFSSLAVPKQIKGFDNKKTMKSFIKYLQTASEKLVKIGDIIQDNIFLLSNVAIKASDNKDWLYSNRYEWDDRNVSEIASMELIISHCESILVVLDSELKDVRNQMTSVRIRSASAGDELTELVEGYLKDGFEVLKAKRNIKNNNFIATLNTKHNNIVTKLINEQKASDAENFRIFTEKIKKLNDEHAKDMSNLRAKHTKDMEDQRLLFVAKLEAQAASFAKVLDDANAKHKSEIADLHVFYKDKIATIVEGYEKTIADLKVIISNYSTKLDEANRLIASYYDALDNSQKRQASLLSEYKELAANRVQKIETQVVEQKISSLDTSKAPVGTDASLSGDMAVNAALGQQTIDKNKLDAAEVKRLKELDDVRNQELKKLAIGGGALTILGALAILALGNKDKTKESSVHSEYKKEEA